MAEHLGMTVGELLSRLSSSELTEWRAYYESDPWDRTRADFHSAQIATVLFNSWRGKDTPAKSVEDFMPYYKAEKQEQSPETQIALLKASLKEKD